VALNLTGSAKISRAQSPDIPQDPPQSLSKDSVQETDKDKKDDKKDEKKDEKKGLPLKSERKVSFTTDEGTWLSLDVSPDGKTIAFELLGDIYTLPIEGGKAKLIDGGMSFDSQPRFSPDGQWIASPIAKAAKTSGS
jgi:dipeptidyl aminopeptidase/acylaminoacyl peptidase